MIKRLSAQNSPFLQQVLVLGAALTLSAGCVHSRARIPSAARVNSYTELRSLYPELSDSAFERKLAEARTPAKFLRSFAPAYYRAFSRAKPSFGAELLKATRFSGWCAGDAHPENFGTRLDDSGAAIFTFIDLDDSGNCSVLADLLHFILSARMGYPGLSDRDALQSILSAYLDGTEGRVKLSLPVRALLERAESRPYFDQELDVYDSDDEEITRELGKKEREALEKSASELLGGISIQRATEYAKTHGGSAGLKRFRAQAEYQNKTVVLEFRTLVQPAVVFENAVNSSRGLMEDPRSRMYQALDLTSPGGRSRWYVVQKFPDSWMLISPRYKGDRPVHLKRDSDEEAKAMLKIIRDEAAVLGELHSRGMSKLQAYLAALRAAKTQEWEAALRLLADELERIHRDAS